MCRHWTTAVAIKVLMEQTIIMTHGASNVTSGHKNLNKGPIDFFTALQKKNCPKKLGSPDL